MKKPNPVNRNIETGVFGENTAVKHLKEKHYRILGRNCKTPFGEIDIVAEDEKEIVFIEVKTRFSEEFGTPLSNITEHKKKNLIKNCLYYCRKFMLLDKTIRIDCIGITLGYKKRVNVLTHVKNAVEINI